MNTNELPIDPAFERRVVDSMRRAGLFRPSPRLLLTAVAASLLIGFFIGTSRPRFFTPKPRGHHYILFLHDTPQSASEGSVEEYRRWAQGLRQRGIMQGGEKLADEVTVLGTDRAQSSLAGYFRITVGSSAEARAVARTCPHLRHGGWIEIREVART